MTTLFAILSLSGCSETTASGTLTDGLSGEPIADMRVIATAKSEVAMRCSVLETHTDAAGAFTFKGLCSESDYTLQPENSNIWLADGDVLPGAGGEGLAFKGFQAPDGRGMYRLLKGELGSIKTSADIQKDPVWNNDSETIAYPSVIPTKPVVIPPDGYLVLVGKESVEQTVFAPLIASGPRVFGSSRTKKIEMKPWSYIGVEFTSDTAFTRKEATVDTSKVVQKTVGDRVASWIPGDALPAGRYVVHKEGATRTTVLVFGEAPAE